MIFFIETHEVLLFKKCLVPVWIQPEHLGYSKNMILGCENGKI